MYLHAAHFFVAFLGFTRMLRLDVNDLPIMYAYMDFFLRKAGQLGRNLEGIRLLRMPRERTPDARDEKRERDSAVNNT